jgi:hypothetical protein
MSLDSSPAAPVQLQLRSAGPEVTGWRQVSYKENVIYLGLTHHIGLRLTDAARSTFLSVALPLFPYASIVLYILMCPKKE